MVASANTFFLLTPPRSLSDLPQALWTYYFFILKERLDEKQTEMMPSKIPKKAILNVSFYNINNQIVGTSMS